MGIKEQKVKSEPQMDHKEIIDKINETQKLWGLGLISIGKATVTSPEKVRELADKMLNSLYDFDSNHETQILFKPTLASTHPFRINKEETLSYFIGGGFIKEDKGFALKPWRNVDFGKSYYLLQGENKILVMGEYDFVDYQGTKTTVDYTFGYRIPKDKREGWRIFLHHSSLRFE
ncbi:hypothetical protein OAT18_01630 [Tenacibaculum sp.]|nr:hypothetical protein [Tenacibaculum sp.]